MKKVRLFIPQIYWFDCPECGETNETGISLYDVDVGDTIVCEACGEEFEVEEIDNN